MPFPEACLLRELTCTFWFLLTVWPGASQLTPNTKPSLYGKSVFCMVSFALVASEDFSLNLGTGDMVYLNKPCTVFCSSFLGHYNPFQLTWIQLTWNFEQKKKQASSDHTDASE